MYQKSKVFLDSSNNALYSGFYIHGIISEFGKENVSFSSQYFKELKRVKGSYFYYMALVVVSPEDSLTKIIIDYHDQPNLSEKAYQWCDIYAKININTTLTESRFFEKMVNIPPGFSIKLWNKAEAAYYGLSNFLKCKSYKNFSWKRFFKDHYTQNKRERLEKYLISIPKRKNLKDNKPYVFFIGRLWNGQHEMDVTNRIRKRFIDACMKAECNFEGGFLAKQQHPQYEELKHICFLKSYSTSDYVKKTKESTIVFNTPTVHNCHGWKLGEFLAMGKAIISTPLSNLLPENFVHGKNIHFISSIDEIESAVNLLLNDHDYRKKLEKGAKEYYEKIASPHRSLQWILNGSKIKDKFN